MSKFYILGVDQSTQGTKAIIFDDQGKLICRQDLPHRQIISDEGWVSHDLNEIYHNVIEVSKRAIEKSGIDKNHIACMGIDNQRETTAAWNRKTGEPAADANVWQCNRAKDICAGIGKDKAAAEDIYMRSGLKLSPYYPAGKMSWFLENNEKVKELASRHELALGTMDSWVIYRLTGGKSYRADYSNASRTQLFNIKDLKWDSVLCDYFGVPEDALPEVTDSDATFGYTDLEGYLEKKIPICGVLGDSHGALFGHNCRRVGSIKATYGTGSSVMLNTGNQAYASRHGLSTSLAWKVKGRASYVLEGNINYTGAVISWLKDNVGLIASAAETQELAVEADPYDKTYIIPAFSGLGAPWWRDDTQAIITGMTRMTGKKELVRAACDCIVYQINDVLEAMKKDTGLNIQELCVDGGPTRNDYLMQFQSDISDLTVRIPDAEELSNIGAVYVAGITAGLYDENTVFNAISYRLFRPEMDAVKRDVKLKGWNKSVQMLLR